jgi:hypothetical protein
MHCLTASLCAPVQASIASILDQLAGLTLRSFPVPCQVLTNWVTYQANNSQSDPRTGRTAMWIQAAGCWIAVLIYLWSLIAPKIFPNRDFGSG